jgi:hypothetical protein
MHLNEVRLKESPTGELGAQILVAAERAKEGAP